MKKTIIITITHVLDLGLNNFTVIILFFIWGKKIQCKNYEYENVNAKINLIISERSFYVINLMDFPKSYNIHTISEQKY